MEGDFMRKKGVTLIELVAVLAIMSIVGTIIYSIFFSGMQIYNVGVDQSGTQDYSRHVFTNIGEDIKKASLVTLFSESDEITLSDIGVCKKKLEAKFDTGTTNLYVLDSNNSLYKVNGSDKVLIAPKLTSLKIEKLLSNSYRITVSINLNGKIKEFTTTAATRNRGGVL